jgi:hypothetical protein
MPAMIHACSESRAVTLEKYSVRLASPFEFPRDFARIDPVQDIVYISKSHKLYPDLVLSNKALNSIQILAMDDCSYDFFDEFEPMVDFKMFPALKELRINRVGPEEDSDYEEEFNDEYYGQCMKEHHTPSAVDIRMVNTRYSAEGYVNIVPEYLVEETMEESINGDPEFELPYVRVVEVERKERKPRRKYWGF